MAVLLKLVNVFNVVTGPSLLMSGFSQNFARETLFLLSPHAQNQWPADGTRSRSPSRPQFVHKFVARVVAMFGQVPSGCGPRTHIVQRVVSRPFCCHRKLASGYLGERHHNIGVLIFDNIALRRPEGIDFAEYRIDNLVAIRTHPAIVINPESKHAIPLEHPARLGKKSVYIEPMKCLSYRDQIDRRRLEATLFRTGNAKFYVVGGFGGRHLLRAGVSCDDIGEVRGERSGRLAIAGCTIPGQVAIRAQSCQERKKRVRITGPMRGITARVPGKMIFELVQRSQFGSRPSAWAWL